MTAPAPTRAEEGRYTVVYKGDPSGNRILNGEPAVGRAVGVMLGDLIERADRAEAEVARLTAENDHLRASLANSGGPCPYCTLPKEEWAKCVSSFPGCARADDAMLCPNVGASLEAEASASVLRERVATLEAALKSILEPFPATVGPAEDMLEDWMAAVSRFRAAARTALEAPPCR